MQDQIEALETWMNLILPKLEAIKNSGDGATIHKAVTYTARIWSCYTLIKYYDKEKYYEPCLEYLREAEQWLIQQAQHFGPIS
jgi:hypothetical protein